jgi:uncharacterized BrkB/YihY/UPF0761 family membrane protein
MKRIVGILKLFIDTYKECIRDRAESLASALAYFQLLGLAPLVGFLIFISIKILGVDKTNENVIPVLKNWFTTPFIKIITFLFESKEKMEVSGLYTLTIVSGIVMAYATKHYFGMIRDVIEIAWNQKSEKPGIKEAIHRLLEDLQIVGVSILIITVFLFLRALLPHPYISDQQNLSNEIKIHVLIVQGLVEFLLFFGLYMYYFINIPPVKVFWKNAIPGAMLGAFIYEIGRVVMRIHMFNNPDIDIAESFLVILIWLYYVNFGFVYAAEFNKVVIARRQNIDLRSLKFEV